MQEEVSVYTARKSPFGNTLDGYIISAHGYSHSGTVLKIEHTTEPTTQPHTEHSSQLTAHSSQLAHSSHSVYPCPMF